MSSVFFYEVASEVGQSNGDTQKSSTDLAFVCLARSCKTGVISKAFPWQPQLLQCSLPQMKFAWAENCLNKVIKFLCVFKFFFFTYFRQISVKAYSLQGRSSDPSLVASSFGSVGARRPDRSPCILVPPFGPCAPVLLAACGHGVPSRLMLCSWMRLWRSLLEVVVGEGCDVEQPKLEFYQAKMQGRYFKTKRAIHVAHSRLEVLD